MKKFLCFTLVMLMLISSFAACGNSKTNKKVNKADKESSADSDVESVDNSNVVSTDESNDESADDNKVENIFVGENVKITLDEALVADNGKAIEGADRVTNNNYNLIPGKTYDKDPTIHVIEGKDCWVFVKLENEIEDIEAMSGTVASQMKANGWILFNGSENIYIYKTTVSAGEDIVVFERFSIAGYIDNSALSAYRGKTITVQAFAVSSLGFKDALEAYVACEMNKFWNTDFTSDVLQVGNVDIEQTEVFDNSASIMPGIEVKKEITVTNIGESDAYIRTIIAVEDTYDMGADLKLHFNCSCADGESCNAWNQPDNGVDDWLQIQVTDKTTGQWTVYTIGIFDYAVAGLENAILPAGESVKSLGSFMIKADADNDFALKAGESIEIYTLTQAVQTSGFRTAEDAFAATFDIGTIGYEDDAIIAEWFGEYLGDGYTVEAFNYTDYDWSQAPLDSAIDIDGTVTR